MFKQCIISQGHIPEFDVQGNLSYVDKQELMSLSILHLRKYNPNAYIILSGHGYSLTREALDVCDWVYWEPKCRPLDPHGYPIGIPAQFPFVSKGLEHARKKYFRHVLKTRTDCIISIPEIYKYCVDIINLEETNFLFTQQTGSDGSSHYLGDCFMFGPIDQMCCLWNEKNPVIHHGGLMNTAAYFAKLYPNEIHVPWKNFIRRYAAFRDVINLGFVDLRWSWNSLKEKYGDGLRNIILDNQLCIGEYHWGRYPGWHIFDDHGSMIKKSIPAFWSEDDFYHE